MGRVDDYLAVLRGEQNSLESGHPADDALLALLVHTAFSDGRVDDHELEFLKRVLPGRGDDELRRWVKDSCKTPLDFDAVAAALPTEDDRWKGLRYAARMAWKDGYLAVEEQTLLNRLSSALGLPQGAVERTLHEAAPRQLPLEPGAIIGAIKSVKWSAVQMAGGSLTSADLAAIVPSDAALVCRIGLESVEMLALYDSGIAGRFREGVAWLPWSDIVAYTRGFGLGSNIKLHIEDGRQFTLVDARLSGVAMVLDRLFGAAREKGEPPHVELVTGDDEDE